MRGRRLVAIGAGLVMCAGSACSLITKLDAPTSDAPGGETFDAGLEELSPPDACAVSGACLDASPLVDAADATPPDYGATYVSQSFPLATTALAMTEGEIISSYIELKNSGSTAWDSSTMLGTTEPRDRTSAFADNTWVAPDRPAAVQGTVKPGQTYRFLFDLKAPQKTGTFYEYFGLVDGTIWFGDVGQGGPADDDIEVQIVVTQ